MLTPAPVYAPYITCLLRLVRGQFYETSLLVSDYENLSKSSKIATNTETAIKFLQALFSFAKLCSKLLLGERGLY